MPISAGPASGGQSVFIYATALYPNGAAADGLTDDTTAIQTVIDACPVGGVVDGYGGTFLVSQLSLHSDMEFRNFNLLAKTPGANLTTPVTINGTSSLIENVTIRNVHINGQRGSMTGSLAGSEDGGRHGFRILGAVENLLMEDCSATLCASDGMTLYSNNSASLQNDHGIMRNMVFNRCHFTYNRRHGVSADAADNIRFIDCTFNDNGGNVSGAGTGASGATLNGNTYGSGATLEEYAVNTYGGDFHFIRCNALRNQRKGLLVYGGPVAANAQGFVVRTGFRIDGGYYDTGIGATADDYAIEFSPASAALGDFYDDVQISDAHLDGAIRLVAVGNARISGGVVGLTGTGYLGVASHVGSLTVSGQGSQRFYLDTSSAAYVDAPPGEIWIAPADFVSGSATPTRALINGIDSWLFSDAAYDLITATVQVPATWTKYRLDVVWANASNGSGAVSWNVAATSYAAGASLSAPINQTNVTTTAGAQDVVVVSSMNLTVAAGNVAIQIYRNGPGGSDTLTNDARLIGVRLVDTSTVNP